jgi:hypothetical protein
VYDFLTRRVLLCGQDRQATACLLYLESAQAGVSRDRVAEPTCCLSLYPDGPAPAKSQKGSGPGCFHATGREMAPAPLSSRSRSGHRGHSFLACRYMLFTWDDRRAG